MIHLNEAVIVEGRYDKIKLSSLVDALIVEVNGFQLFKDTEKMRFIADLSKNRGIIILTDSDAAGLLLRNKITEIARGGRVYHAYIPQIAGKERRKTSPSAEGFLGVEGVDPQWIMNALKNCGIQSQKKSAAIPPNEQIDNACLYELKITGHENSKAVKTALLKRLNLPTNLSKNSLLRVLKDRMTRSQLQKIMKETAGDEQWQETQSKN